MVVVAYCNNLAVITICLVTNYRDGCNVVTFDMLLVNNALMPIVSILPDIFHNFNLYLQVNFETSSEIQ